MALEPVIVRCPNLPTEYGVPVPTGIKKLILSVLDLPKTTSGASYNYLSDIEIVDGLMYYVMPMNVIDNDISTAKLGASDSHYNDNKYVKVIDPNSVFIHHSERQSVYSSVAYLEPKNGYPRNKIDSIEQFDIKLPCPYVFGSDYNSGGSIAVNEDNVSVEGYAIDVVCKIKFSIVYKSGKYDDEKTYSNRISISSIISSLGMRLPYREITGSGANLYSLGNSSELNINMCRPNVVYGSTFSYGFWVNASNYKNTSSTLSKIYTNNSGTISSLNPSDLFAEIPTSLYYLLFPKIIFADTVERIDTLLRMSPEDFKKEIKYDIGEDPYAPVNPSAPSGGNGSYGSGESYFQSGTLIPNGSAETDDSATGLYTRYAVSIPILQSVGDWLWAESLGLQVAKTLVSLLYGDPIQTIISCVSYPFGLDSVGLTGTTLKWGGHDTGVSIDCLTKSSYQIDWGTITVSEYWGNFLDYSPHTKMQLFLPWGTGFVDIDPNDIMRAKPTTGTDSSTPIEIGADGTGTISVITNIEFSRGICVHHVVANRIGGYGGTIIGTYSGSCGRQIPITGSDYASKQVAVAGSAIAAMVTGALAGGSAIKDRESMSIINNPHGMFKAKSAEPRLTKVDAEGKHHDPITGKFAKAPMPEQRYDFRRGEVNTDKIKNIVAKGSKPALASAASILVSPPHVTRSGSFQEGSGGLTPQAPYLLISRPRVNIPSEYGAYYGYPSNINLNLQFLRGYTEIAEIHLDNIPATVEEIFELEDLLKGGVIL